MQNSSFSPRDDFSKALLKSIPTKVTAWLRNLGLLKTQKGCAGDLSWRIRNNNGKSFIQINGTRIEWIGPIGDIDFVYTNQGWADDISKNMDHFVALEKSIYDEIQKLDDAFYEAQKIPVNLQRGDAQNDGVLPTHQTA